MTDEELIETLRKGEVTLSVVVSAAVRIEELVKERDDAEWVEVLRKTYQRAKEAEAKLDMAVEALRNIAHGGGYTDMQIARAVLAELEKTK